MIKTTLPFDLIKMKAKEFGLDPLLVAAICMQESSGRTNVNRFEPGYRWLYKEETFAAKFGCPIEDEKKGQMHSYGLMQVMGAVFREYGFDGSFEKTYEPEINLHYGCKHLAKFFKKYGNENDAIASYNAGSPRMDPATRKYKNQAYVDGVLKLKASLDGKL